MLTSQFFLKFMNDTFEVYKDEDKVISIHGYVYPVKGILPPTFFMRGADCWGWATWKRGWGLFEPDGTKLLSKLQEQNLERDFDLGGAYPFTRMLKKQIAGKNNSWAIRWHASAFLNGKLTLYPGISLIFNTGLDSSGTHCRSSDVFDAKVSSKPVSVSRIPLIENEDAREAISAYLRSVNPSLARRAANMINGMVKKIS